MSELRCGELLWEEVSSVDCPVDEIGYGFHPCGWIEGLCFSCVDTIHVVWVLVVERLVVWSVESGLVLVVVVVIVVVVVEMLVIASTIKVVIVIEGVG